MSRADEFREAAEEARQLAEEARESHHRELLLLIAYHWERLAEEVERNPTAFVDGDGR